MTRRADGLLRRPAVAMAVGTTLSRVTGLVRTVALAAALGVTAVGDAYNGANTVPNVVFHLLAGGVLSAAFVPVLVRQEEERRAEVASVLLTLTLGVALVASLAVVVAARPIMGVVLRGAASRAEYPLLVDRAASWLSIFAPQISFYAVSVAAVGIMTARRRLGLGAVAPVGTNLVTTAGAVLFVMLGRSQPELGALRTNQLAVLGWATTAGVGLMAALQLWGARRAEPGLRLRFDLRHPAVRALLRTGGWVLLYVAVNQVGLTVVVALASRVEGGVSAYQWAFTFMQLPYAVVGVSIFSAAFPGIARTALEGTAAVAGQVSRAMGGAVALLVPAAVGLGFAAGPLATAVVGSDRAGLVAAALRGFAVSLLPFSVFQLLTRTAYAVGQGAAPAVTNVAVNVAMVVVDIGALAVIGSDSGRLAALAAGHAASYVVGCAVLGRRLGRLGAVRWDWLRDRTVVTAVGAAAVIAAVLVLFPGSTAPDRRSAVRALAVQATLVVPLLAAAWFLGSRGGRRTTRSSP